MRKQLKDPDFWFRLRSAHARLVHLRRVAHTERYRVGVSAAGPVWLARWEAEIESVLDGTHAIYTSMAGVYEDKD